MAIPKTIHYVWLGDGEKPGLVKKCIESWYSKLPDYEFKEWNTTNFNVGMNRFCREAFEVKKWAFATDYARCWILYNYGGIYMDCDVEVTKEFDIFLNNRAFGCYEAKPLFIEAAVLGAEPKFSLFKKLLDYYENRPFILNDGNYDMLPIPSIIRKILIESGAIISKEQQHIDGFNIYPQEYFSPCDPDTGKYNITENTYAIHRYTHSWKSKEIGQYRLYVNRHGTKLGKKLFTVCHPVMAMKIVKDKRKSSLLEKRELNDQNYRKINFLHVEF